MNQFQFKEWPRVKGIYVRDDGRIFSEIGITFRKVFAKRSTNKYGHYAACYISKSEVGDRKSHFVHRIICETYHPVENFENLEVNHKDGNKLNNHPSNLEWSTVSENRKHAYSTGLNPIGKKVGSGNGRAKLDEVQVLTIRSLNGLISRDNIARYFGVAKGSIHNVTQRRTWLHI